MVAMATNGFHEVDYSIFTAVLATSIAIGLYHAFSGGKQRTTNEYLMANRQMKTLPVALSILVSFVSGILVLGTPAEMYTRGTQLMMRIIGYCIACFLSSRFLVPLFFTIRVTSSFEYLERRYKSKTVKLIGTVGMLVGNLFYMGLVIYTPAVALEAVTGFPLAGSIVATAAVATVYTALGGLKAVIWTDVFQAGVMVVGMVAIIARGVFLVGGFQRVWTLNEDAGRIIFFNFDPDPTVRLTFWSTVIGGTFSTLTIFGIGQTSVQRYCTLPTLSQAQWSVYLNIPFLVVMNALAAAVGLVMFAYYADKGCDPLANKDIRSANQLLPYYVMNVLTVPGLPGAFLAVLFSGALSSISSSLNSAAAVTWQDILRYAFVGLSESRKTLATKLLVVFYGTLSLGVAFGTRMIGGHVLQASLSFTGATMGPTLGMFLLGALFPFANAKGAVVGCLISALFSLWLAIGTFIVRPHSATLPTSVSNCSQDYSLHNSTYSMNATNLSEINSTYFADSNFYDNWTTSDSSSYGSCRSADISSPATGICKMYEISFLWYSAIGCLTTLVIGVLVSLITRSDDDKPPDPELLIPLRECIFGCFKRAPLKNLHNHGSVALTTKSDLEETSITPLKYNLTTDELVDVTDVSRVEHSSSTNFESLTDSTASVETTASNKVEMDFVTRYTTNNFVVRL